MRENDDIDDIDDIGKSFREKTFSRNLPVGRSSSSDVGNLTPPLLPLRPYPGFFFLTRLKKSYYIFLVLFNDQTYKAGSTFLKLRLVPRTQVL